MRFNQLFAFLIQFVQFCFFLFHIKLFIQFLELFLLHQFLSPLLNGSLNFLHFDFAISWFLDSAILFNFLAWDLNDYFFFYLLRLFRFLLSFFNGFFISLLNDFSLVFEKFLFLFPFKFLKLLFILLLVFLFQNKSRSTHVFHIIFANELVDPFDGIRTH